MAEQEQSPQYPCCSPLFPRGEPPPFDLASLRPASGLVRFRAMPVADAPARQTSSKASNRDRENPPGTTMVRGRTPEARSGETSEGSSSC